MQFETGSEMMRYKDILMFDGSDIEWIMNFNGTTMKHARGGHVAIPMFHNRSHSSQNKGRFSHPVGIIIHKNVLLLNFRAIACNCRGLLSF